MNNCVYRTVGSIMIGLAMIGLAMIVVGLPAHAKYVVFTKAPKGYLDNTQQRQYAVRLDKEIGHYDTHKSDKVRLWHSEVKLKSGDIAARLNRVYSTSGKSVRYQRERVDIWYTPGETIVRGTGDCDDFANMYLTAAYLAGIDPDGMWLVAGRIRTRSGLEGHAIAVIDASDGKQYVLDNMVGRVVQEDVHKFFKPVYSINIGKRIAYIQVNTAFKDSF